VVKEGIMFTIYHNPRCRKSRAGLQFLQQHAVEPRIREYFKEPVTVSELTDLLHKLNKKPFEIVRTQEGFFKKSLKGKQFTDYEWIKILVENPQLIQRPIVVKKYKAVIGDPVENIGELIGS
jgi:arsenate reductase